MTRDYVSTLEVRAGARDSWAALQSQLVDLADDGHVLPCRVYDFAFFSEEPEDRAIAALACLECPAMVACARFALANDETGGVWGGVDLTPDRTRRRVDVRAELELIAAIRAVA